jgi:hypothetical protein
MNNDRTPTSGGVNFDKTADTWHADLYLIDTLVRLGTYKEKQYAVIAKRAGEIMRNHYENHTDTEPAVIELGDFEHYEQAVVARKAAEVARDFYENDLTEEIQKLNNHINDLTIEPALLKASHVTALMEKEQKYFSLVWYARKVRFVIHDDGTRTPVTVNDLHDAYPEMGISGAELISERLSSVRKESPTETKALDDCEDDNWQHGFNSGCLAAFRYALSMAEDMHRMGEEEFPFLDT